MLKIGLEVLLISVGVFLGLMGEQWREHARHRELAETSLRRFRTEIQRNMTQMIEVRNYHVTMDKALKDFLDSDQPRTAKRFETVVPMTHGIAPVPFERTAWDLAVATGSLAYIDASLAFSLSRVYTSQQGLADQQRMIVQSTIYGRSWSSDFEGYWRSVSYYFSDLAILEPAMLSTFEEALREIDRALGESPTEHSAAK